MYPYSFVTCQLQHIQ